MQPTSTAYLLAGITLLSEIPLPELPGLKGESGPADSVRIRLNSVPFLLAGGVELDPDCLATASEYLLRVPGVARYRVSRGVEIAIEPEDSAPPENVRAYLLGVVFAVLCHQRGLLPLHASAVRHRGGVTAFAAPSGHGKSSLAAHLSKRGFEVVADDICLVDATPEGSVAVIPAAPWLKLWRSALEQLGRTPQGLDRIFDEDEKYRLPVTTVTAAAGPPQPAPAPLPLRNLIFVERDPAAEPRKVQLAALPRLQAIGLLMNLTHQAYLLEATGQRGEHFLRCGNVLSGARPYRLLRPWGFEFMEETLDRLEELAASS